MVRDGREITKQATDEQGRPQVVDLALLQDYLRLQVDALRADKEARDKRKEQRATLQRIVKEFGPPTLWIVALVALGIWTAKMHSGPRLSAAIMQPPSLIQHLGVVLKAP